MKKILFFIIMFIILSVSEVDALTTLSDTMLINSTGELTVEDAISSIEEKGTPDFGSIAPSPASYTDNLPTRISTITASSRRMSSYSSRYYTYASSYSFDEVTGTYSLVNASVGKYSSIYSKLGGKYVVSYTGSTSSNKATSTNLNTIYYITDETTSSTLYYISSTVSIASYDYSKDGLYMTEDDYGTSYYYRGAVEDNYVFFAGYYWRIIRRNGDGSVRLIYDGTEVHSNGESSTDRYIGTSEFNEDYNDNAYVGYMYGIAKASSYDDTHTNTNESMIKEYLDNWYESNLIDYEDYLSDSIFCNDREVYSGIGYSTLTANYSEYNRLINKSPVLTCTLVNDAFSVNDTINGNGDLTYPIGLITADEASMAGGQYNLLNNASNTNYYLYIGTYYWTMTPYVINNGKAYNMIVGVTGALGYSVVNGLGGVKPVINISNDVFVLSGNGKIDSPYVLSLTSDEEEQERVEENNNEDNSSEIEESIINPDTGNNTPNIIGFILIFCSVILIVLYSKKYM